MALATGRTSRSSDEPITTPWPTPLSALKLPTFFAGPPSLKTFWCCRKAASKQGFVFPSNPRAKLGLALKTGVVVDDKKLRQAFYTPKSVADEN